MLSKGDYMPNLSADRKNFYNDPGHRDYSWKALFRINDSTHIDALNILKQILDDDNFNAANVSESLKVIINKRKRKDIPLWRRLLTSDYGVQILFTLVKVLSLLQMVKFKTPSFMVHQNEVGIIQN